MASAPSLFERLKAEAAKSATPKTLRDFMRKVSPQYQYPTHLGPYLDILERVAKGERLRFVISAPPRHTKTETTLHALTWLMRLHPWMKIAYITYGADLSHSKSRDAQWLAERAGVKIVTRAIDEWRVEGGGRFTATGIGGPQTGKGFHLVVVDDPVKDRAEAESQLIRDRTWDWFNATCFTRQEPGGTSFLVIQTRWHADDLAGRLIAQGWPCLNLRAIDDDGAALWPSQWPVEKLLEIKEQIGPYDFAALYQGMPRERGGGVFSPPSVYDALPTTGYRVSIGCDFAYTSKTYSDYNTAVVLYHTKGLTYVAEVARERCDVAQFKPIVQKLHAKHGGSVTAYVASTEMGVVEFLKSDRNGTSGRLDVNGIRAAVDKFTRAQPVSAAWNAGKVMMPRNAQACSRESLNGKGSAPAPWADMFLGEVLTFTGVKDKHDDMVDALAGAFYPFESRPTPIYRSFAALPDA